jgi:hypothetical protein
MQPQCSPHVIFHAVQDRNRHYIENPQLPREPGTNAIYTTLPSYLIQTNQRKITDAETLPGADLSVMDEAQFVATLTVERAESSPWLLDSELWFSPSAGDSD